MSRIPLPREDQLDDAQREVYDDIKSGRRGAVLDLFMMLMHNPKLADRAQRLGVFLRYETSLETRSGSAPKFENADEAAIYAYAREVLTNRHASDETYAAALAHFGNAGMVELTCLIGYYCMIALTLNEHGVPLPEGAEPALPPPGQ